MGLDRRPLRRAEELKGAKLDKLFALSTAQRHARGRARAEAGRRRGGRVQAALGRRVRARRAGDRRAARLRRRRTPGPRSAPERHYGFEWLVVRDRDFEDLVTTVHLVARELVQRGFGEQLLAALFAFEGREHPAYLIYGFKRGHVLAVRPQRRGKERDNAEELRLKAKLESELPIEPDLSRWLGLFDAPL